MLYYKTLKYFLSGNGTSEKAEVTLKYSVEEGDADKIKIGCPFYSAKQITRIYDPRFKKGDLMLCY